MSEPIERILEEHSRMVANRAPWEGVWQEIARRILPLQQFTPKASPGELDTSLFDATAGSAVGRFTAALNGFLCPPGQYWHHLKGPQRVRQSAAVRRYLERARNLLFELRYAQGAGFETGQLGVWNSLAAFGHGPLYVEEQLGQGIRYQAVPAREVYLGEDAFGRLDTLHRRYQLEARQVAQLFENLPQDLVTKADKQPGDKVDLLHVVRPRPGGDRKRRDAREFPFASYHIALQGKRILRESGYRTFCYPTARYQVMPGEVYGRGPGHMSLPDNRLVNRIKRAVIAQANRHAEPPMGAPDEDVQYDPRPNAVTPGAVTQDGKQLLIPLVAGSQWQLPMQLLEDTRQAIRENFLDTLWQVLVDNPRATATEVLQRAQEKGILLGPALAMLQAPYLGVVIERELDIVAGAGLLDDMPDELREAGGLVNVDFDSPLNRAARAPEALAIVETFQMIAPMAQVDPGVLDIIDMPAAAEAIARARGVPEYLIVDPDTRAAKAQQRAQQQQQQALLEHAPGLASAAKDVASIQQQQAAA